jgi:23S rRNA G2445 N2-methylase RlmL
MANKKEITKIKDQYFAICPHSFEELLVAECKNVGIKQINPTKGGVYFESTPEKAIELLLKTRVASRVFKQFYSFDIKNEKDIYFYAKEIKWKALFNLDQTFKIDVTLGHSPDGFKRSKFTNTMFLGQKLKDAIVDRFRDDTNGKRPDVDKYDPDVLIQVRIEPVDNKFSQKEKVTISLDLSGTILSNRGYRIRTVEAPIRENLAAGLLMIANIQDKEDFYDPMCGGGTFLVEATLIKGNISPSFLKIKEYLQDNESKPWSFLGLEFYKKNKYLVSNTEELIKEINENNLKGMQKLRELKIKIYGTDIDQSSIKAAKMNIANAGLADLIYLEVADGTTFNPGEFKGKIVTNPPYGERLGEIDELKPIYHELGENLKQQFKDCEAYLITSNLELLKEISLRTSFRKELKNGKLESRFVKYELF